MRGGWLCVQALLPPGMAELLWLAAEGGAEGAGPWPRVHAFNTLRLAFIERLLAVSATPYIADGTRPSFAPCECVQAERSHARLCPEARFRHGVLQT